MRKRHYSALLESDVSHVSDAPVALTHNLVSTTQIRSSVIPIDLGALANKLFNSTYDRSRFAALTIRIALPCGNCTALLFSSGKVVLTGTKSMSESILASLYIVRMLRELNLGVSFEVEAINTQNVVGDVKLDIPEGWELDIQSIFDDHNTLCTYQSSLFPGLIFRPHKSPVVLICFLSGKIVITGGKSEDDISLGWRRQWPTIRKYIRKSRRNM